MPLSAGVLQRGSQALGSDPHLECVLLHVDPLNEQLDDPRLLGWNMGPTPTELIVSWLTSMEKRSD
jgi:hypothetical protein